MTVDPFMFPGRWIHLAAGEHADKFPNWFNVDGFDGPGIDLVLDLTRPGWADEIGYQCGSPDVVYVGHFIEHLTRDEATVFVNELRGLIAPSGVAVFVGPDVPKARVMARRGLVPVDLVRACEVHGEIDPENPSDRRDVHAWNTSGTEVVALLSDAGWLAEEQPVSPWPLATVPCIDDGAWQYLVVGNLRP